MLGHVLTGGFLKGYRTYVMMGMAVIGLLVQYSVGDADLISTLTGVAAALGVSALRASNPTPPAA